MSTKILANRRIAVEFGRTRTFDLNETDPGERRRRLAVSAIWGVD
jgi:hypothetical protein